MEAGIELVLVVLSMTLLSSTSASGWPRRHRTTPSPAQAWTAKPTTSTSTTSTTTYTPITSTTTTTTTTTTTPTTSTTTTTTTTTSTATATPVISVFLSAFNRQKPRVRKTYKLMCRVQGYPEDIGEVLWGRYIETHDKVEYIKPPVQRFPNTTRQNANDKYLVVSEPFKTLDQVFILVIYNLNYSDDGLYYCAIENGDTIYVDSKYKLQVEGKPEIRPMEETINGIVGFRVHIKINYQSRPRLTSVQWYGLYGVILDENNPKYQFLESLEPHQGYVTLNMANFSRADRGVYKLELGNKYGKQSVQFTLEAHPFVDIVSPNVTSAMPHASFFYGTTAVFDCRANNFQTKPVFQWRLEGRRLSDLKAKGSVDEISSMVQSKMFSTWVSRATIRGITFDFIGAIVCTVEEDNESYSDSNIVDVNGSPVIQSTMRTVRAGTDQTVELKCNVSSNPPVSRLQWIFKRNIIQFSESTSDNPTRESALEMSLKVEVTSSKDYGSYMCQAVNMYGSNGYTINVMDIPHVCQDCLEPEVCNNDTGQCVGAMKQGKPIENYLWAGVGAGSVLIVALVMTIALYMCWKKRNTTKRSNSEDDPWTTAAYSHAQYATANIYEIITRSSDEFPRERVRLLHAIGVGKFGRVMKAEALSINRTGDWEEVAVKMCQDHATDLDKEDLYNELKIIRTIPKHVNVVSFYGACTYGEPLLLILEFVPGGDLRHYLRRRRPDYDKVWENPYCEVDSQFKLVLKEQEEEEEGGLTAKDLLSFALQTARGMHHLASNSIIHRDVAARNVLVGYNGVCKVSDFGLARDVEGVDVYERTSKGPLPIRWMAPESLMEGSHSHTADVWSFGILLWEIVTLGASPYSTMTLRGVIDAVVTGKRLERPQHCMDEIYLLMKHCWEHLPRDRPSFSELSEHLEYLLEKEADYIQLDQFQEAVYMVLEEPQSLEERL